MSLRTVLWAHRERPSPVGTGARVLAWARAATAWRRRGSPGKEITLNHPIHPDNFSQPASQPWVKFWDPFRSTLPCHLPAKEAQKSNPETKSKLFAEPRQSPKPKPHHAYAWFILPNFSKVPSPNLITLAHGSFCRSAAKTQSRNVMWTEAPLIGGGG